MSTDPAPEREERPLSAPHRAGPALARAAADAARGGKRRRPSGDGRDAGVTSRAGGYSGARPDERDPQLLGTEIARLFRQRGWEQAHAQARIFGSWDQLVGAEIASKCHPVSLRDGELIVAATSTAWATQLRMLAGSMLTGLRRELAAAGGAVRIVRVHGPVRPSWKHGMRSVPGRGPRDTYG